MFDELKNHLAIMRDLNGIVEERADDDDDDSPPERFAVLTQFDMLVVRTQCERYQCLHSYVSLVDPAQC